MSTDIKIKGIRMEDFVNYKKPSMFIGFPTCSFKCCKEGNFPIEVCQNCELANASTIDFISFPFQLTSSLQQLNQNFQGIYLPSLFLH